MNFADKLINLRKQHNLSQEELAEQLQVSRQAVSRWEQGATLPDAPNLLALSNIFAVSTDYLLRDELTEPQPATAAAAEAPLPGGMSKEKKKYLFLAIIWVIAAMCWMLATIISPRFNAMLIGLLNTGVAAIYIYKYATCP